MPTTVAAIPDQDIESPAEESTSGGDERNCVVCCRPCLTFCGRFDDGPVTGNVFEDDPDTLCVDCLEGNCTICGCAVFEICKICNP